jgi:NADPH-dependent 2,4-dienoyl-CoA reductase/sulfur reductase-like enzyme
VIGGGPTGLRTAASLHNRGFRVTLVEALPYLLGQLGSEQAGSTLAGAACAAGIRVVTGAPVKSASHDAGGHLEGIACATPTGGDLTVDCSLAVVCTGVSGILPAGLHTSAAGTKHGFIPVDETMRTTHPNVWAAGDVALPPGWSRPPGLWRVAAWQGRQAALTMAGRPPGPVLDRVDLTLRFLDVFVWASRPYAAAAGQAVADGQYGSDGAGALPGWRVEIGPPGAVAEPTRDFRLEVAAGAD